MGSNSPSQPNLNNRLQAVWDWLTQPFVAESNPHIQLRLQTVASLLLVMLALIPLTHLLYLRGSQTQLVIVDDVVTFIAILAAYFLCRQKLLSASILLLAVVSINNIFVNALAAQTFDPYRLGHIALFVVIVSIAMPLRTVLAIVLLEVWALLFLPIFQPSFTYSYIFSAPIPFTLTILSLSLLVNRYYVLAGEITAQEIKKSNERWETLAKNLPVLITAMDDQGRVVFWNDESERVTGYAATEIVDRPQVMKLFYPDETYREQIEKGRIERSNQFRGWDLILTAKDGARKTITWWNISADHPVPGWATWSVGVDVTAQRQAEWAIRESETRFRLLADNATDVIYHFRMTEPIGFEYISPSVNHLLGYTVEEFFADPSLALRMIHPDDFSLLDKISTSPHPLPITVRWFTKDGRIVYSDVMNSSLYDDSGNLLAINGIARDVTEREMAQRLERKQRQLAEALREATAALTSTLEIEGVLDHILESVGKVFAYEAADISIVQSGVVKSVRRQGFAARGMDGWMADLRFSLSDLWIYKEMAATSLPLVIAKTISEPNWIVFPEASWINSYAGAPITYKEELLGYISLLSPTSGFYTQTDADPLKAFADQAAIAFENARLYAAAQQEIVLREQLRASLAESELRLSGIVNSAMDAIISIDASNNICIFNPAAEQIFGYKAEQVLGQPFEVLLPLVNRETHRAALDDFVQAEGGPQEIGAMGIMWGRRANGEEFPIEASVSHAQLGNDHYFTAIVRDITERLRAENAEREQRELAEALIDIAAALNNTLDFNEVSERVLNNVARVVPYSAASIALREGNQCRLAGWKGKENYALDMAVLGQTRPWNVIPLDREAIETRQAVVIADIRTEPRWLPLQSNPWIRSYVIVPLAQREYVLGLLYIASDQPDQFTPAHANWLTAFANLAANAIANAQLFDSLRQQTVKIDTLYQAETRHASGLATVSKIIQSLNAATDMASASPELMEGLRTVTGCEQVVISLIDTSVTPHAIRMFKMPVNNLETGGVLVDPVETFIGNDILAGRMHLTPDLGVEIRNSIELSHYQAGFRSRMALPLRVRQNVIGSLNLAWTKLGGYEMSQLPLLTQVAEALAMALEKSRLMAETRASLLREQQLNEISRTLSSSLNIDEILLSVVQQAVSLTGADSGALALVSNDGESVHYPHLYNLPQNLSLQPAPKGVGVAWQVILTGQSLILTDYKSFPTALPQWIEAGLKAAIVSPVMSGERYVGVLGLFFFSGERQFTKREAQLAESVARQMGVSIHNARLFEQATIRAHELEALAEVSAQLRATQSRSEMLPIILQHSISLLNAHSAAIEMVDQASGQIVTELASGEWMNLIGRQTPLGKGISSRVVITGQPYRTDDLRNDPNVYLPGIGADFPDSVHAICAPLIAQEKTIGTLWVGCHTHFADEELGLLIAIADIAAGAIHRAALFDQTRLRAEQLAAVNTLGRALAETYELTQIYQKLYEATAQLLPDISAVLISLFDAERKLVTLVYGIREGKWMNVEALGPRPLPLEKHAPQAEAIRTHLPIIVNYLDQEEADLASEFLTPGNSKSALIVPMFAKGEVIGVVQTESNTTNRFGHNDAELLALVANTAAVAIENARLFADANRRLERMRALHSIDMAITTNLELDTTLDVLLDQTIRRLGIHAADVLLLDAATKTLRYAASLGFETEALRYTNLPLGSGNAGVAAQRRSIVHVKDLEIESGEFVRSPLIVEEGFRSYYGVPLIAKDHVLGVLEIFHREPLDPDPEWLDFLNSLAAQAAVGIENATLFSQLSQSLEELKTAQGTLIQAARLSAVGELAAGVAHQINNPLTTIIADAQLLTRVMPEEHPSHASAAAIHQAGWRAQRVVQRLLNFARPDRGEMKPADLNETVTEALDLVGAHLGRGGADVELDLAPDLPSLTANGHQLQEIWLNLMMNARDALMQGRRGLIKITTRFIEADNMLEVRVSDNGQGIRAEDQVKIFAPFFTTKGENRGNGLGLSVCQRIARNHGGDITFESQEGQGTTFIIRLPLTQS